MEIFARLPLESACNAQRKARAFFSKRGKKIASRPRSERTRSIPRRYADVKGIKRNASVFFETGRGESRLDRVDVFARPGPEPKRKKGYTVARVRERWRRIASWPGFRARRKTGRRRTSPEVNGVRGGLCVSGASRRVASRDKGTRGGQKHA